MKEISFTLKAGSEVPQRLDGTVVRGSAPESAADLPKASGFSGVVLTLTGDAEAVKKADAVITSVFNESFILNHFQKPAKRASGMKDATAESIQKATDEHKPGVRSLRDPNAAPRATGLRKEEVAIQNDLLAQLEAIDPAKAAEYKQRMQAIADKRKASRKPKAEGGTETPAASGNAAATAPATPAAGAKVQGAKKR